MMDIFTVLNVFKLGGVIVVGIFAVCILSYAAIAVWHWLDRGERKIPHLYTELFKLKDDTTTYQLQDNDGYTYSHVYESLDLAKSILERKKVQYPYSWGGGEVVSSCPSHEFLVSLWLSLLTACATAIVAFIVAFPVIAMWVISTVGGAYGLRAIIDLQKGTSKLVKGLKTHMEDTEAHTADAVKVDTEVVGMFDSQGG